MLSVLALHTPSKKMEKQGSRQSDKTDQQSGSEDRRRRRTSSGGGPRKKMPENMKSVRRKSIVEDFVEVADDPVPQVPQGGARIKVCFAGATYSDGQVVRSGQRRPKMPGINDTSLFPGYEVSGIVHEICNTVAEQVEVNVGDPVIVYADNDDDDSQGNYAEFLVVKNVDQLIRLPRELPLEVASLLPCGALMGYTAVLRSKPFVEAKLSTAASSSEPTNILIVGAGGLGLWTLKMAKRFISEMSFDPASVRITVADTNVEKLMVAKEQGCFDVVHWSEHIYEEHILERTRDVCEGGVDICIDFVSSPRTVSRATKVLKEEGVLVVGGNSRYDVSFDLNTLAARGQSVLGVKKGTKEQLAQLVKEVAEGTVSPPLYTVFPVEDANKVFQQLNQCKLNGRAVLKISTSIEEETPEEETDSAFQ